MSKMESGEMCMEDMMRDASSVMSVMTRAGLGGSGGTHR